MEKYNSFKDEAVVKLVVAMENEDDQNVKNTISETIDTIKRKKFDRLEYFRLKNLVNNI
jgi:hypothetical protein